MSLNLNVNKVIEELEVVMPAIVLLSDIPKYTGNAITVGTLANRSGDSDLPYFMVGKKATYLKDDFLKFFKNYLLNSNPPESQQDE